MLRLFVAEETQKIDLEWEAYDRPYKVWSKEFYSTVIVLAFLTSVILYFIEGIMPVVVVWALVFLMWSMNRVEPQKIKYQVTKWGVVVDQKLFRWEEVNYFWIETKWGSRVARVSITKMPWNLILVMDPKEEQKIKETFEKKVRYVQPEPTWFDKVMRWVGDRVPLE